MFRAVQIERNYLGSDVFGFVNSLNFSVNCLRKINAAAAAKTTGKEKPKIFCECLR